MSQTERQPMTFEQFVAWERRRARRHKFADGRAITMTGATMAGATMAHSIIHDRHDTLDPVRDEANE